MSNTNTSVAQIGRATVNEDESGGTRMLMEFAIGIKITLAVPGDASDAAIEKFWSTAYVIVENIAGEEIAPWFINEAVRQLQQHVERSAA